MPGLRAKLWGLFCFLSLTMVVLSTPAFPCSLASNLPVAPTPNEHVFIGKVVGYSGPIEIDKLKSPTWGIRIQVTGKVELPPPKRDEYEVYFFSTDSMCRHNGLSKEDVQSKYQVGEQVQVVAMPWTEGAAKYDRFILSVPPFLDARYAARPSKANVTVESQFDYKLPQWYEKDTWEVRVEATVFSFEWRKDLIRLRNSKNDGERVLTLKRMIMLPYDNERWFYQNLCPQLVEKNISEPAKRTTLLGDCARLLQRYEIKAAGAYSEASALDSKLPNMPFQTWLLRFGEPDPKLLWEVHDCEKTAGSSESGALDYPVCVEARLTLPGDRFVTVIINAGTRQTGASKHPVVDKIYFDEKGKRRSLKALHELLNFVRYQDCPEGSGSKHDQCN